ncbi:LysE family translocator [Thaumasiovibrio subtropicus]|uniref:LysE family translocator n=1 Tax=Thaumasiovibrio subtropicus TaxID=1891207 RepID=UPI000B34F671|nr:LysE family translocator [Thaumasiovibrio subtropicus]
MSLFVVWVGVMFPLVFSPGPANIVFAASGAKVGVKRSLPLIAGVDTVFLLKSVMVGFGLGELLSRFPNTLNVMQLLGSLYLVYMAIQFAKPNTQDARETRSSLGFVDGVIVQALNSKGWLMVLLMFTLFSEQATNEFGQYGIVMLIVWLAILNIGTHIIWVALGDLLSRVSQSPRYEKGLNYAYATSLCLVSGWLLYENPLFQH